MWMCLYLYHGSTNWKAAEFTDNSSKPGHNILELYNVSLHV